MTQIFNQTNATNFVLEIADNKLTDTFKLNVQSVPLPSISIPVTKASGQGQGLSTGAFPGSGFEFEPLRITFLLDEKMLSWLNMYKWMLSTNNYVDRSESGWNIKDTQKSVMLHISDNDRKNVVMTINFLGAFCSELSDCDYDYTVKDDPAMICSAVINYRAMEVMVDNKRVVGRYDDINNNNAKFGTHPSLRNR